MNSKGLSRTIIAVVLIAIIVIAAAVAAVYFLPNTGKGNTIKVAIVLYGHRDLGSWDPTMARGIEDLVAAGYQVKPTYCEETQIVDAVSVLRNAASMNDLVFVTSYIYQDAAVQVAKEYPNKPFILQEDLLSDAQNLVNSGLPSNLLVFSNEQTFAQSLYLQGLCAGCMTKTNAVGFVVVDNSPGSAAKVNAVVQGLHAINPKVQYPYVIIGTWSDPIKSRDATAALVAKGCDIIWNGMDDESVDEECLYLNVSSIHEYRDVLLTYPNTVQSDGVWNMSGYLKDPVQSVINGDWKTYWQNAGIGDVTLKNNGINVLLGSMVPTSVADQVNQAKNSIISGQLTLQYNMTWP